MNLIVKCVASVAAIWGATSASPAREAPLRIEQTSETKIAEFDSFLQAFRKKHAIPALSAVIVKDGAILWEKAYGFSDDEGEIPATVDTSFSIASVTKPIAAIAILKEAEAGRISLDVPMTADAGWLETCQWLAGSSIPFGGGGADAHGAAIPKINCDRKLTLGDILNMRINGAAGAGFVYNPISFARIDRIIEGAGGRPLRQIVRENVATPAGLEDVALGWRDPDGGAALRLIAPPFSVKNGQRTKNSFSDDDFRAAAGNQGQPSSTCPLRYCTGLRQALGARLAKKRGRRASPATERRLSMGLVRPGVEGTPADVALWLGRGSVFGHLPQGAGATGKPHRARQH